MKVAVVLSLFIVQVFAMTTKHHGHHSGPTHPPAVHETFAFRYDPLSSTVVAKVGHICYVYKATGSELTEVHTAHGLHTIEMTVIKMIDDKTATYTTMTTLDMTTLSKTQSHLCTAHNAHPTIFKLNF
ncbi:uncharacterized protein [Mytilus edulis]|uniref:uncharacterized protein n=1 Tax=Mytilus edulis TaxID=6550 RepID=UPI0039F0BB82